MRSDKVSIPRMLGNILPVYLLLYFLFISNYFKFSFPVITYLVMPFEYLSAKIIQLINIVFIHKTFTGEITLDDNYWLYVAVATYFILAVIITVIWTIVSGSKEQPKLFSYLSTYSRYYLAFMMLDYGLAKVFGNQFGEPWPNDLIQPLGELNVHSLLWDFMGASRSYNFFAGLLEVIAGALLLFRRTTVIGAIASVVVLLNVLMLNIGYDVQVKTMTAHLIWIGIFILYPDFNRLVKFFFHTGVRSEDALQGVASRFRPAWTVLNLLLIGYVLFVYIGRNVDRRNGRAATTWSALNGVYEIRSFQKFNGNIGVEENDLKWTKLAIMNGYTTIRFGADSSSLFIATIDTAKRMIAMQNPTDSVFKSNLSFDRNAEQYNFNGMFGKDSITVSAVRVDATKLPLNKDRGKIQWLWY